MIPARLLGATLLTAAAAAASHAPARAALSDSWPLIAFASDQDCALNITSGGRVMLLRASGLIPGETVHLALTNGDMTPLRLTLRASSDGLIERYYLPFRFNRDGGTVGVTIDAARCSLTASAPWTRQLVTIR